MLVFLSCMQAGKNATPAEIAITLRIADLLFI
jgi:hypothetical protein